MMEVAENTQNKVENETSEIHKSPIKDTVDNGGGDIASNNKPIENNDVKKAPAKNKRLSKLERMSQENAALLKELGVNPNDENADSGRRRTRSQARGVTNPPATPVEETKSKRGRKPRETKEDSDSGSNKKSAPPTPVKESGQKRGRGRPPKNAHPAKKVKENDEVVKENAEDTDNAKNEGATHEESKNEVDGKEKKVETEVEKKEDEKVLPEAASEPEKPKEPEPTKTTAIPEEKTNGEESVEKEQQKKSEQKSSEPEPMDTKPSEVAESLTTSTPTPNEN